MFCPQLNIRLPTDTFLLTSKVFSLESVVSLGFAQVTHHLFKSHTDGDYAQFDTLSEYLLHEDSSIKVFSLCLPFPNCAWHSPSQCQWPVFNVKVVVTLLLARSLKHPSLKSLKIPPVHQQEMILTHLSPTSAMPVRSVSVENIHECQQDVLCTCPIPYILIVFFMWFFQFHQMFPIKDMRYTIGGEVGIGKFKIGTLPLTYPFSTTWELLDFSMSDVLTKK